MITKNSKNSVENSFLKNLFSKKNQSENPEEDDQRFIKKDEASQDAESEQISEVKSQLDEIVIDLKQSSAIRPEGYQQRNLDREIGGLEEEKIKQSSEKDAWDDRSEEVDKMGSTDTFNTTSMKSTVWRHKKDRLTRKKLAKDHQNAAENSLAAISSINSKNNVSSFDSMSNLQKLKNLRQDRSSSNQGNSR
jgi:hypothetical protein